jgi:hypothetical protein
MFYFVRWSAVGYLAIQIWASNMGGNRPVDASAGQGVGMTVLRHLGSGGQAREAPMQRLADVVAGRFCYTVMAASAATFAFWTLAGMRLTLFLHAVCMHCSRPCPLRATIPEGSHLALLQWSKRMIVGCGARRYMRPDLARARVHTQAPRYSRRRWAQLAPRRAAARRWRWAPSWRLTC